MSRLASKHPHRDRLYEIAAAQEGLFTTQQAAEAGYSPQLLVYHLSSGTAVRVRRSIYRLVHFPAGEHEEFARSTTARATASRRSCCDKPRRTRSAEASSYAPTCPMSAPR